MECSSYQFRKYVITFQAMMLKTKNFQQLSTIFSWESLKKEKKIKNDIIMYKRYVLQLNIAYNR